MSDIQGALKELIIPKGERPKVMPWGAGKPGTEVHLKKVRPRHLMIVSLSMAGFTATEIGERLGYTTGRVHQILNSRNPQLVAHREHMATKVAGQIGDLVMRFRSESPRSLDTLIEIRDDRDAPRSERRLSALAILDRAGYSPVHKQINLDAKIPVQELASTLNQIASANEVIQRRAEWEIRDQPVSK